MDKEIVFRNIDEYIKSRREPHKSMLQDLRKTIKAAAPEAVEVISYNMPAFKIFGRILVYFAAHTSHIGFYPASAEVQTAFGEELKAYVTSKGTVRFPVEKKIPVALVKKIIAFKIGQIKNRKGNS